MGYQTRDRQKSKCPAHRQLTGICSLSFSARAVPKGKIILSCFVSPILSVTPRDRFLPFWPLFLALFPSWFVLLTQSEDLAQAAWLTRHQPASWWGIGPEGRNLELKTHSFKQVPLTPSPSLQFCLCAVVDILFPQIPHL